MSKDKAHPLFDSQREKKGSETFSRYLYQYHWGLHRVLTRHVSRDEYALIVELHEDVVIADSLDENAAKFEFNQVKNLARSLTVAALTKIPAKSENSVLGKLVANAEGKRNSDRLSKLNLVTTKGCSIKQKNEKLKLDTLTTEDIHADALAELARAIKKELAIEPFPATVQFLLSDLPATRFEDIVVADINRLVDELFPGSRSNCLEIYRVLFDDLKMKGQVSVDIREWEEFLRRKALTSNKVTEVINRFVNLPDETAIQMKFQSIASDLGYTAVTRLKLEREFNRYRVQRVANRSGFQFQISAEILRNLEAGIEKSIDNFPDLIEFTEDQIDDSTVKQFSNRNALHAAIICEFINLSHADQ